MLSPFVATSALMGKTAVITGASRGIGRATAIRLHQAGAQVGLCARSTGELAQLAEELGQGAHVEPLDVTDRGAVDRVLPALAKKLGGRIDIVVNNAGVSLPTPVDATDDSNWHAVLAINLDAPMFVTRAALPFLTNGGSIVNISSILGKLGVPFKGAYCAAKHGVIGWTRSAAVELAPRGIRMNVICPGWVDTEMGAGAVADAAAAEGISPEAFRQRVQQMVPLRRFLAPEEIAELVAFLASSAAGGITAGVFPITAGGDPF